MCSLYGFVLIVWLCNTGEYAAPSPPGSSTLHAHWPLAGGSWFNMFNLGGKSPEDMMALKKKEIENGRLAMLAMFGYGAQAVITSQVSRAWYLCRAGEWCIHHILPSTACTQLLWTLK